jgi:ankyrin repeat protein
MMQEPKKNPLIWAAMSGCAHSVEFILKQGGGASIIHQCDDEGKNALFWAVSSGNVDCAEVLLRSGANPNDGESLLILATQNGHLDMAKLLLRFHAAVDLVDISGRSALFYATSSDAIEMLVTHGAKINATDLDGKTALHYHCFMDTTDADVVMELLNRGADIEIESKFGMSPLLAAVKKNNKARVNLLLNYDISDNQSKALSLAAASGHADLVQMLVCRGVQVFRKPLDLQLAVESGETMLVELLLTHSTVTATEVAEAIDAALNDDRREELKMLVEHQKDDIDQESILKAVASYDYPEIVESLLKRGVKFPSDILFDVTDATVAQMFIDHGANVNATRPNGKTVLMDKLKYGGNKEVVRVLLDNAVDVDAVDEDGKTALMWAAGDHQEVEMVKLLLNDGFADASLIDKNGWTAFVWSGMKEYYNIEFGKEVRKLLLKSTTTNPKKRKSSFLA